MAYAFQVIIDALSLGSFYALAALGIGLWMGILMAFTVWAIIWPNPKKPLGIVELDADAKKKAARMAMLASRSNTMLSIPMLYAMVSAQNIY